MYVTYIHAVRVGRQPAQTGLTPNEDCIWVLPLVRGAGVESPNLQVVG